MSYLAENADVNVALSKDCTISPWKIAANQVVNVNLNKHIMTINGSSCTFVNGNLKLTNGKVVDNKRGIGLTANNAKLELDGIDYEAPTGAAGIYNDKNIQNTTLIIKNSTMKGGYYVVSTNASTNPVGNTIITLENSEFTADETAFMVNIPATVNVTGCTFTGGWQGVFLRGGTTTFTDCSINLKFDGGYETSNVASGVTEWKSGNQAPAAALTMGNRSKSAYDYPTQVTLTNTTFSNTGTDKNGKDATTYPAIYIDADKAKENQGVTFTYDAVSQASFKASGSGLFINEGAKVEHSLTGN